MPCFSNRSESKRGLKRSNVRLVVEANVLGIVMSSSSWEEEEESKEGAKVSKDLAQP